MINFKINKNKNLLLTNVSILWAIIISGLAFYLVPSMLYILANSVSTGPIGDGWIELPHLINIITGNGTINDWVWPHGEHRILTTRIFMFIDHYFNSGRNELALVRAVLLYTTHILLFSWLICKRTNFDAYTKVFLVFLVMILYNLSPLQSSLTVPIHHVWPIQLFCATAAFCAFAQIVYYQQACNTAKANKWLIVAIVFATLANWSFGQGALIWFILLYFGYRNKLTFKQLLIIFISALLNLYLYFHGWSPSGAAMPALTQPYAAFVYLLHLIALPLGYNNPDFSIGLGLFGLILFIVIIYKTLVSDINIKLIDICKFKTIEKILFYKHTWDSYRLVHICLLIFSFIGLLAIAAGRFYRVGDGVMVDGILIPSMRFFNQSIIFWLSLISLVFYYIRDYKLNIFKVCVLAWIFFILLPYHFKIQYTSKSFVENQNMIQNILALHVESKDSIEFFERPGTYESYVGSTFPKMAELNLGGYGLWQNKLINKPFLDKDILNIDNIENKTNVKLYHGLKHDLNNKVNYKGLVGYYPIGNIISSSEIINILAVFDDSNRPSAFINGNVKKECRNNIDYIVITDPNYIVRGFGNILLPEKDFWETYIIKKPTEIFWQGIVKLTPDNSIQKEGFFAFGVSQIKNNACFLSKFDINRTNKLVNNS